MNFRPKKTNPLLLFLPLIGIVAFMALWLLFGAWDYYRTKQIYRGHPRVTVRIVSLAPNLTEIIAALDAGYRLAGRSDSCDYPAGVEAVPSTGEFGNPNIEKILALRPTHVVYTDLQDKTIPDKLRRYNIAVHEIPCAALHDIAPAFRILGELTGHRGEGEALATELETRLSELHAKVVENPPTVFIFLWNDPIVTVGSDSFITDLVRLAGGRNVFDDVPNAYFNVPPEQAVSRNPDMILSLVSEKPGTLAPLLSKNPGWAATRAIRENKVIEGLPLDLVCRPGPRVVEAIEAIHEALGKMK